ncbi:RRXRR domain-containing protein [Nostoc sp.]
MPYTPRKSKPRFLNRTRPQGWLAPSLNSFLRFPD